jgi:hypothetical protein
MGLFAVLAGGTNFRIVGEPRLSTHYLIGRLKEKSTLIKPSCFVEREKQPQVLRLVCPPRRANSLRMTAFR